MSYRIQYLPKHNLKNFLKIKEISKKLKLRLKNTITDKTLTCASETWILREREKANEHF